MGWPGIVLLGAVIGLAGWWLHPLRRSSRTRFWAALLAGVLGAAFARLAGNVRRIMQATVRMTWAQSRFSLLLGAVTALGTAAVFWVGADQALKGAISLGTIRPCFLRYMLNPLTDFRTADQ